ncbi:MAG: PKD domain-containing protein [Bacteroidales bacterium]|nr:PKD domain-containing protein [Bacteroidales bacterium]
MPTASFSASSTIVETNESIWFSNLSLNASRYEWSFGDGNYSTDYSPSYSYSREGTYTVTLKAYSESGEKVNSAMQTIYVTEPYEPVGDVMFWMSQQTYEVTVTLNGQNRSISLYYPYSTPECGSSGCANFVDLPAGSYSYYAENSLYYWSGSITVTDGGCKTMRLYFTKAQLKNPIGEKTPMMEEGF